MCQCVCSSCHIKHCMAPALPHYPLVEQSANHGGTDSLESYMKTLGHQLTKSDKYEMRQKIHQMRKVGGLVGGA